MSLPGASASRARPRARQGSVAIITALVLVLLCGFAALAVDVGDMYRVRAQTQAAVDAAALAGAMALNGTASGLSAATQSATTFGGFHQVYTSQLQLTPSEIELGHWDIEARIFTTPAATASATNAVRVRHLTEDMRHPFGAILGQGSSAVGAGAIAVGGGPSSAACAFPLIVPDCALTPAVQDGSCGYCMQMQDSNADTAGWTVFGGGHAVNGNTIFEEIAAACTTGADQTPAVDPVTGMCMSKCSNKVNLPTDLPVNNGNFMNTGGPRNFCELIQKILNRTGTPSPFKVTAPVMKTGQTAPCNPAFVGEQPVSGFAQLTILGARCGTNEPEVRAPHASKQSCNPPSGKYLLAELDCNSRINAPGGGAFFGLGARPRLVR